MSEVDRLSNSGLYPALPIADKRNRKDSDQPAKDKKPNESAPKAGDNSNQPRPPKSLIDEYA
jgi:hypothetical protein